MTARLTAVAHARAPSSDVALAAHPRALIVPAVRGHTATGVLPVAVLDQNRERITDADCATNAMSSRDFTPSTKQRQVQAHLSGRWLFGGIASWHFGHQITRMLGRMPWLAEAGALDGIVFAGFRKSSNFPKERKTRRALFQLFGVDLPIKVVFEQTEVDELLVGPDLFGEGLKCRAHPRFRSWARDALGLDRQPMIPGKKIYVTREKLPGTAGRILAEEVLEENLAANGFEIFAPEEHDLPTQLATYASAETIVMTDGSPGHISAFAFREGQKQTVIARRFERPIFLMNHLKSFAKDGGQLEYSTRLKRQWWPPHRASNVALGELDFAATLADLQAFGTLPKRDIPWRAPSESELNASKRRGLEVGQSLTSDDARPAFLETLRTSRRKMPMLNELDETQRDLPEIKGLRYFRVLNRLHGLLQPNWYLEVGTFTGRSLTLARGNYIAVDPNFRIEHPIVNAGANRMYLFQETSDDFFASNFLEKNEIKVDMAFLDGLHHFEVLLRDFINTEKHMSPDGVIILHDCCPTSHAMTSRVQGPGNWTGDVWKTLLILQRNRPDLTFRVLDAAPTGLVVISGLDPDNRHLEGAYDQLIEEYSDLSLADMPSGLESYYAEVDVIAALDGLESLRLSRT